MICVNDFYSLGISHYMTFFLKQCFVFSFISNNRINIMVYIYILTMSEVIGVHVGQCGSRIGNQFWKQIIEQHQIQTLKDQGNLHFFNEENKQSKCRSLFWDLEARQLQNIIISDKQRHYKQSNFVIGTEQSRNIYGQAYYRSGQLKQTFFQILSKEIEKCDQLCGFVTTNGMAGGTGSGIHNILVQELSSFYSSANIATFSVMPEIDRYCSPCQIYNTIFSIPGFLECCSFNILYQNSSAEMILQSRKIQNSKANFKELNQLLGLGIVEATSSHRFSGKLNSNIRKLATNLIPFPRMKFLTQSISQQNRCESHILSALKKKNRLIGKSWANSSKFFAMNANCRDPFAYEQQIYSQIRLHNKKVGIVETDWIPSSTHISLQNNFNSKRGPSTNIITNDPIIKESFNGISEQFVKLFRRKAFVHHYTECGMDQMQFTQAESNINDLVSEYTPCTGSYDDEEDDE